MSGLQPSTPPPVVDRSDMRRLIEHSVVLLLLALLLLGVLLVLKPFAVAIMFGGFIAIGLWPLRDALVRRGVGRISAAALMLALLVLIFLVPLLIIAPGLALQVREGVDMARNALAHAPEQPPAWLAGLPLVGDDAERTWPRIRDAQGDLQALLEPYAETISDALVALGRGVFGSLVQMVLALIVAASFWINGDRLAATLRDVAARLAGATAVMAVDAAGGAVRGVAWGVVGTGVLQAVLLGIGLAIAGVPGAATLAFLAFVCSVSQVLGPLVIVAWAAPAWWLYASGETGWAIFMALWGAILVSGSDNVVRPLLISRGSTMPLALIILGVFGGLITFGFLGLFVGPAVLAVFHALMNAWRHPPEAPPAA